MNLNRIITGLIVTAVPLAVLANPIYADMCNESYGTRTCQSSDLTVNKQVAITDKNGNQVFYENLGSDRAVLPGTQVLFKLTIKNASGETFDPVSVIDVLPAHLTFVAGPGTYDQPGKPGGTLRFSLEKMIAGETRTVQILTKAVEVADLPKGPSVFCEDNTATVTALNRNDQDKAQVCIGTQTIGTSTLPVAGFDNFVTILPFLGLGLTGVSLITLAKKS